MSLLLGAAHRNSHTPQGDSQLLAKPRQAESSVGAEGLTLAMPSKLVCLLVLSQNSWGGLQRLSSSIIFLSQQEIRDSGDRDGLEKNHLCRL